MKTLMNQVIRLYIPFILFCVACGNTPTPSDMIIEDISFDGSTYSLGLKWDSITNADQYKYLLRIDEKNIEENIVSMTKGELDVPETFAGNILTAEVRAISNGNSSLPLVRRLILSDDLSINGKSILDFPFRSDIDSVVTTDIIFNFTAYSGVIIGDNLLEVSCDILPETVYGSLVIMNQESGASLGKSEKNDSLNKGFSYYICEENEACQCINEAQRDACLRKSCVQILILSDGA